MTSVPLVEGGVDGFRLRADGRVLAAGDPGTPIPGAGYVAAGRISLEGARTLFLANRLSLAVEVGSAHGSSLRNRAFILAPPEGSTLPADFQRVQRGRKAAVSGSRLLYTGGRWQQPLWFIQRGLRWFPLLARRLDLTLFLEAADVAPSWNELRPLPTAAAELRLAAVLFQFVPLDIRLGAAWLPTAAAAPWFLYLNFTGSDLF